MLKKITAIVISLTIFIITVTQSRMNSSASARSDMINQSKEWILESMNDASLVSGNNINLDFDLDIYRADRYLKESTPSNKAIKSMGSLSYPSQTIVNALENDGSFEKKVTAWKAAHFATSPSDIINGKLDEKGYYEAIILSIFVSQSDNSSFIGDQVKKINSEANVVLKNVSKWVKESDAIEASKISKDQILSALSTDEQKAIQKYCAGLFEENHPLLDGSTYITRTMKTVFSSSDTIIEAFERMCAYVQLCDLSLQQKAVLQKMHKTCPSSNIALKSALEEVAESLDSFQDGTVAAFANASLTQGNKLLGTLIDEGWEAVIKSNPYVAVFMAGASIGTFLGDTVCSTLFSTDKTVEQYMKMKCLSNFNGLMRSVLSDFESTYQTKKDSQNAKNYIEAIETVFAIASLSCDFARNYGEIIYNDALIGKLVNRSEDIDEFYTVIDQTKKDYENIHEILVNDYFDGLESDYPEIYKNMMSDMEELSASELLKKVKVSVVPKSFNKKTQKSVIKISFPSEITSVNFDKVTFKSSNKKVASIDKDGKIKAKNKGTSVITVKVFLKDGMYKKVIFKITVGKKKATVSNGGTSVNDSSDNNLLNSNLPNGDSVRNIVAISLGRDQSGALMQDGSLYMWGNNLEGRPVKILDNVTSFILGMSHNGALTQDGSLYMWGRNSSGQLGDGTNEYQSRPIKVLDNVVSFSLGGQHSGAVTKDGSLYMWGYNFYGQLGDGTMTNRSKPVKILDNVASLSLGYIHSGAITADGSLYMWGDNSYGQLGDGTNTSQLKPVKVLDNVASFSLGGNHSGALTKDGSLYMWGDNLYGRLGDGTRKDQLRPIKIEL